MIRCLGSTFQRLLVVPLQQGDAKLQNWSQRSGCSLPGQLQCDNPRLWQGTCDLGAWDTRDGIFFEPKALLKATYRAEQTKPLTTPGGLRAYSSLKPRFHELLKDQSKAWKACRGIPGQIQPDSPLRHNIDIMHSQAALKFRLECNRLGLTAHLSQFDRLPRLMLYRTNRL